MALPKRWTRLHRHTEQQRLWREDKRFKVAVAGRRSGKTELAKRKLVLSLFEKKPWSDPRYFAAAPTRGQAKRIFWKDLKALIPNKWIRKVYETDLCITTKFGSELWVLGLDKPQRVEGTRWDGCVLDEYANMRAGVLGENIRPALSDRLGWCWLIGVPEGLNHFKDIADYARGGSDPEWGFYSWHSADILRATEIEGARRLLDPRTFRQEYEASFESATGRVYYAFSSALHIDPEIELNRAGPLLVCCDFNVSPCVWVICQSDGQTVWVIDEVVLHNTNTVDMAMEVRRRYDTRKLRVIVYGDAAGASRSTAGKSDYALLSECGFNDHRLKRSNPFVKDRVNAVNSMLRNTRGEVRLRVHPRCKYLIRDFETVAWSEGGGEINKRDSERTHASDGLGYYISYEFGLNVKKKSPERIFYK